MIQLKKNPFSNSCVEYEFVEGESAQQVFDRVLLESGFSSASEQFQLLLNGNLIEKDYLPQVIILGSDNILVCPIIAGGSSGQVFKQVAVIAVVIAVTALTKNLGPGLQAGAVLAASIGATLALEALIPTPVPYLGSLSSLDNATIESSQMYSITGQSNQARKFGTVPKAYGQHRMFPVLAANPYVELQVDPRDTTKVAQYFVGIYDFGYGPALISDLKIGNTPITEYDECTFRLVDLNKPLVSTGPWDDVVSSSFLLYRGDVQTDGTSVSLDENESNILAPESAYRVVRNAATNTENVLQTITLDFICPEGLIAYDTQGGAYDRQIAIQAEFSPVGQENWKPFDNTVFATDIYSAGGSPANSTQVLAGTPFTSDLINGWTLLSTYVAGDTYSIYGYPAGATTIRVLAGTISIGANLTWVDVVTPANGTISLGTVTNVVSYNPNYDTITLSSPIPQDIRQFIENSSGGFEGGVPRPIQNNSNSGVFLISAKTTSAVYATLSFSPLLIADYKVRVTRLFTTSSYEYQPRDKLTLFQVRTRFDTNPIVTDKRHVFGEIRVRATGQLNGSIQNLSGVVSSVLDVYDSGTQTWSKQPTSNPAWIFADILTGEINKKRINKNRLHTDSLLEWAAFCDAIPTPPPSQTFLEKRFEANFIFDFAATVQALLNSLCNSAQASFNIIDGKYGVFVDKLQTVPVQIFTPRNSSNFSSSRTYVEQPHALKIRYVDPNNSWESSELVVYADGYDINTATKFEELSSFACTNHEQAWRFGRYMMAQAKLRRELITIDVDFEYLACTRGDFVQITQDVMKVGGRPARVKSITANRVKIDDAIDTDPMLNYGYVYRSVADGIVTSTLTVVDSDEFDLDGDLPAVGDLIVIGEVDKLVLDCLVKAINPGNDLTAQLTLIEKADEVYDAESTDVLPDYSPNINTNIDSQVAAPGPVQNLAVITNSWRVIFERAYQYYITIDWDFPILGGAYENFEVYVDNGNGYALHDLTKNTEYEYIVDTANLEKLHRFKVLGVSSTGKKLNLFDAPEVTATPTMKITPPSDVLALYINVTNQIVQLDWDPIVDSDVKGYNLRYSPDFTNASWETSTTLLSTDRNNTLASVQGRTGTYFIKAVDINGNESLLPSQAVTSIPNLFDLNVIEEITDFPALPGTKDRVITTGSDLILQTLVPGDQFTNQYYPEGYYYLTSFLDLGEIYTVRLQSAVYAEGFQVGDLMSEWSSLDDVDFLTDLSVSEWGVETQYRATNTLNSMSDWTQLSLIDPLSEGDEDNWTDWRNFTIGDFTGRIFQFRLHLISNLPNVSPRVLETIIKADMPDRLDSYENLAVPDTGLTVVYDPSFKGPGSSPNIQVSIDNASQGDYWAISGKTLDSFHITFYDKNNVAVARQADFAIKGFGRKAVEVI